jgi:hypothetical protein
VGIAFGMFELMMPVVSSLSASARRFDTDVRKAASKVLTSQDLHLPSVLRYLRDPQMPPVLQGLVELSVLPLKGVETDFATDSTGIGICRLLHWFGQKWSDESHKNSQNLGDPP